MNPHLGPLFYFAPSPLQIGRRPPWLGSTCCSNSGTLRPRGASSPLPFYQRGSYPREIKLENCHLFPIYSSAELLTYFTIFDRILPRFHRGMDSKTRLSFQC